MDSTSDAGRAAAEANAASKKRDDLIRQAYAEGSTTIRALAAATGLSTARIHQILHHR